MYGELRPVGGGKSIALTKSTLLVGRKDVCDIVLRFPNVSSAHCQLVLHEGYWHVRDLQSTNGTLVNGAKVTEARLPPGAMLSITRTHRFRVEYSPADLGAERSPEDEVSLSKVLSKSLAEAAGCRPDELRRAAEKLGDAARHELLSGDRDPFRDPNRPVE